MIKLVLNIKIILFAAGALCLTIIDHSQLTWVVYFLAALSLCQEILTAAILLIQPMNED